MKNTNLLVALADLPAEKAALLDFPLLDLEQFKAVSEHLYAVLDREAAEAADQGGK